MRSLIRAIGFLSVLPMGRLAHFEAANISALLAMFPLAGVFLGGMLGGFWHALLKIFGTQLSAALVVSAWALLTRGLHLDGLSDCADGIGGGYTPERRLEIMKDPHVGVFGTVAVVCALLLKFSLLSALTFHSLEASGPFVAQLNSRAWLHRAILLGVIFSAARLSPLIVACGSRYARAEGLGKDFVASAKVWVLCLGAIVPLIAAFAWSGPGGLQVIMATACTAIFARLFFRIKLGGQTGDTMGASIELSEIAGMLVIVGGNA